jgi:3-oxoacyl-[acyl-carrier-protein] synthase III
VRIAAIAASLPSKIVSNGDVLDIIEQESRRTFAGDLPDALREIGFFLAYSGSAKRHWLSEDERPLDLIQKAVEQSVEAAGISKDAIDLIIYTGIARGFMEPANAYHIARALGFKHVECFDVVDACMSWMRSVYLCDALFHRGGYNNALIINAEFNMGGSDAVLPRVFQLKNREAIGWSFPAYTLGEAATATLLCAEAGYPWEFHFASRPDLAELCNIPLKHYQGYCDPSDKVARNGENHFTSFGFELHRHARTEATAIFRELACPHSELASVFTHASSKRDWDLMARDIGIHEKVRHVYPETGNLGSASVPTAIAAAAQSNVLARGEKFAAWVGSAGMSFGVFVAEY